jgi:signal transduction histidine kinase
MLESLTIITSSVTILSLVFLFLYFRKYQDWSDLQKKVRELENLERRDHETQQVRDDALAIVTHELRAPLSVIKGSADLIIKEVDKLSKDQIFDLLHQIKSSSSELLRMVNDMMDISKIESGRFEIFKKDWSLTELLTAESHRYAGLAKDDGLTLQMNLDPSVSHLKFDPERLKQVMNNLLSNAIKFTPKGGRIDIISEKTDDNYVKVIVADTGVGIPEDIKSRLFNKFVQGRSKGMNGEKGTGLGLAIAKGIVEAHGGSIWTEDNKPQGTKFVFTLPFS